MRKIEWIALLAFAWGCSGDVKNPGPEGNDTEVITTVELTIDGVVATWTDLEQDGAPVVDPITLAADSSVPVSVRFLNELEDPAEDITVEVDAESDVHQVFWGSTAPLAFTYDDTDANGLPVGLTGTLDVGAAGSGTLRVVLRHMPEQGGVAVKVAGLEDTFAASGVDALPGESDADVTFDVTVE